MTSSGVLTELRSQHNCCIACGYLLHFSQYSKLSRPHQSSIVCHKHHRLLSKWSRSLELFDKPLFQALPTLRLGFLRFEKPLQGHRQWISRLRVFQGERVTGLDLNWTYWKIAPCRSCPLHTRSSASRSPACDPPITGAPFYLHRLTWWLCCLPNWQYRLGRLWRCKRRRSFLLYPRLFLPPQTFAEIASLRKRTLSKSLLSGCLENLRLSL